MFTAVLEVDKRPYDRCIGCEYLGKSCDGPNLMAVSPERRCDWANKLKRYRHNQDPKWTNEYISRTSGISIATVAKFFSGKSEDMKISTIAPIMELLIGSWGQYPCAMEEAEKRTVYLDSPETLAECKRQKEKIEELTEQISFYKEQIKQKDALLTERADYLRLKDRFIKWLTVTLAVLVTLILIALLIDALNENLGFIWIDKLTAKITGRNISAGINNIKGWRI